MKKIDVQITKGEIESFSVTLKDGQPTVTATVGLFTSNSKKITTFQISTETYYGAQFELPTEKNGNDRPIGHQTKPKGRQSCCTLLDYLTIQSEPLIATPLMDNTQTLLWATELTFIFMMKTATQLKKKAFWSRFWKRIELGDGSPSGE
jgi:uncharacterized membrane protein